MNKLLFFLFFLLNGLVFSQIISGIILTENESPIAEVNIYIDGSQIHTTSDSKGSFSFDIQNQKNRMLVFQKNGYETSTIKIGDVIGKKVKVILQKIQEIEEVVLIPYTDEAYKKYISHFLNQFVGFDQTNVKIKNQKALKFAFDKKNQILKVKSNEPLIIKNKNLAYEIQYNLMNFESDFKNNRVAFSGTSFFKDQKPKKSNLVKRLNAYHGSIMHFLRSAYKDDVAKEGFWVNHVIKLDKKKISPKENGMALIATKIPTASFMQNVGEKRMMDFGDILQVNYPKFYFEIKKSKIVKSVSSVPQTSYIYVEGNVFEIYPDGNSSEPELMLLQGSLSNNKMGMYLPLDYEPKVE